MAGLSISVVVPCYQASSKMEGTIRSVLSQDGCDLECLIIDGASTDATVAEIERFTGDARIRWWSEPDRGVYDAMNRGITRARGEFLFFLGAGDTLRPRVLREVATIARQPDPPGFLYGDVFRLDCKRRYDGPFSRAKLLHRNICHQAIFYHRSIFAKLGLFDLNYPIWADYEFNMRCFGSRSIVKQYMNLVVADYEGNGLSHACLDDVFLQRMGAHVLREFGLGFWVLANRKLIFNPRQLIRAFRHARYSLNQG